MKEVEQKRDERKEKKKPFQLAITTMCSVIGK